MKHTKKELKEICNNIMYSTEIKSKVDIDKAQWLMKNIMSYHPEWNEKGKNIDYIYVDRNIYGTRCFWIHYKDNTNDDISIGKCILNMTKEEVNNINI